MHPDRIIGTYTGRERGPLLICLAGMHGNEHAGVKAVDLVLKMLEVEPITNPDFLFRGRIIGIRGNIKALQKNTRFIKKDLNRSLFHDRIDAIKNTPDNRLDAEDQEIKELILTVEREIEDYQPEKVIVLDLHTTTAFGGIFSIASNDPESVRIGIELHAPVITGFLKGIQGTTMHYFSKEVFKRDIVTVVFESGQHEEALSTNRAIAAIINCMRTVESVNSEDVENRHDHLLIEYSAGLPKVAELIEWYRVAPEDKFEMLPNYKNFQQVKKGQILAHDAQGPVKASNDGLLLMPKYQAQGDDGFFLIRELNGY